MTALGFAKSVLGAALLLALVIGLEIGLVLFLDNVLNMNLQPRGLGWVMMPIGAALAGWRIGPEVKSEHFRKVAVAVTQLSLPHLSKRATRLVVAGIVLWTSLVATTFWLFKPLGEYWTGEEWKRFWGILALPPVAGVFGAYLLLWANKRDVV